VRCRWLAYRVGMDHADVAAYLARIGAAHPAAPDLTALRELHLRHLYAVPFENLSIHLGEPVRLDEKSLLDKVVHRRRGGFCYELNGAFSALLSALGFRVTLLAARVAGAGGMAPLFDHLVLRVDAPEPWLVDVGFGRFCRYPLRLDVRDDQDDPEGTFRIEETPEGDLDVTMDGEPQYRLEPRPRALTDFVFGCWWHQTSPESHFTRNMVCSLAVPGGRITLSGRTLIETSGGARHERELTGDADVLAAYRERFGVTLDRVPALR